MHSQQEKEKSLEHIAYEIDILDFIYDQLITITNPGRPSRTNYEKHLEDVLLDCFVIHAENLFHFYYKAGYSSDILAVEYVNDTALFESERGAEGDFLRIVDITTKRNKQVAHLTWSRVDIFDDIRKYWNWDEIYLQLKEKQEVFMRNLPQGIKAELLLQIDKMARSDYHLPQVVSPGRGCTGPSPAP